MLLHENVFPPSDRTDNGFKIERSRIAFVHTSLPRARARESRRLAMFPGLSLATV